MPKQLAEFLIQLSSDPQKLDEFQKDPHGVMKAAGLSPEDQQAVLSRNPSSLRQQLGQLYVSHLTDDSLPPPKKKPIPKPKPKPKPKKKATKKKR